MNTKAFYKLTNKRNEIENQLEQYDNQIRECREKAKKLPKGSKDRLSLMADAQRMKDCKEYITLEAELNTINFCINSVFYN